MFDQEYPKLSSLPESAKLKYRTVSKSGVPAEVFANAYQECNAMSADKDASGNTIDGSKKKKVVNYIMSIRGLTMTQRKAIWNAIKGTMTDK